MGSLRENFSVQKIISYFGRPITFLSTYRLIKQYRIKGEGEKTLIGLKKVVYDSRELCIYISI